MKILYFCTTWGQKHEDWDTFCKKVKHAEYDGIETSLPPAGEDNEMLEALNRYELELIGQHWQTNTTDFVAHQLEYSERIKLLAALKPLSINSHTGRDHFSFDNNAVLLDIAARISAQAGIPINHETHRSRFAFAAHITLPYLERFPHLELVLDVSHWCSVAESLLQDQQEALDLALDRTRHIHARVGFPQGPQVPDFTHPHYQEALQFHLECWDKVVMKHKKEGKPTLMITPEFGPPPYMQSVSDNPRDTQWKLNEDMLKMLKARYK